MHRPASGGNNARALVMPKDLKALLFGASPTDPAMLAAVVAAAAYVARIA